MKNKTNVLPVEKMSYVKNVPCETKLRFKKFSKNILKVSCHLKQRKKEKREMKYLLFFTQRLVNISLYTYNSYIISINCIYNSLLQNIQKYKGQKTDLMRWKSGRCPSEASFSGIHTNRPVRLVAFKSQTGSDWHPFFVADIVGLAWTFAASTVLSERKTYCY